MVDGWGNEFYYYSPPPHQTYRLWSAGANGKTFPPWVTDRDLAQITGGVGANSGGSGKSASETIQEWVADDIVQMSH